MLGVTRATGLVKFKLRDCHGAFGAPLRHINASRLGIFETEFCNREPYFRALRSGSEDAPPRMLFDDASGRTCHNIQTASRQRAGIRKQIIIIVRGGRQRIINRESRRSVNRGNVHKSYQKSASAFSVRNKEATRKER
jgi:hypothetical protein